MMEVIDDLLRGVSIEVALLVLLLLPVLLLLFLLLPPLLLLPLFMLLIFIAFFYCYWYYIDSIMYSCWKLVSQYLHLYCIYKLLCLSENVFDVKSVSRTVLREDDDRSLRRWCKGRIIGGILLWLFLAAIQARGYSLRLIPTVLLVPWINTSRSEGMFGT